VNSWVRREDVPGTSTLSQALMGRVKKSGDRDSQPVRPSNILVMPDMVQFQRGCIGFELEQSSQTEAAMFENFRQVSRLPAPSVGLARPSDDLRGLSRQVVGRHGYLISEMNAATRKRSGEQSIN